MTQVKVFSVLGKIEEAKLNKFLGGVKVIDIVYIGTRVSQGRLPQPEVMVVYEVQG